ncbi:ATP-dependent DNA helicase [Candidatus Poriferisodalis sp.]|uniref:ATP-dependent DNA helicase n=1 Tax=Candidatus Poriferisodalis sp. TaxID=3101277 RepID=UPI003B0289B8
MELTDAQQAAVKGAVAFLNDGDTKLQTSDDPEPMGGWQGTADFGDDELQNGIKRLGGLAGAGKTTCLSAIAAAVEPAPLVLAPTNRACVVLRHKGVPASTIHSALYTPMSRMLQDQLADLQGDLDTLPPGPEAGQVKAAMTRLLKQIDEAEQAGGEASEVSFATSQDCALAEAPSIIVDEASMVTTGILSDMRSVTSAPILFSGDHAQLPPVEGESVLTDEPIDWELTENMRVGDQKDLGDLAVQVRNEGRFPQRTGTPAAVWRPVQTLVENLSWPDVVIASRNATVIKLNRLARAQRGLTSKLPDAGDRVVALGNDPKQGLFNGRLYTVLEQLAPPPTDSDDVTTHQGRPCKIRGQLEPGEKMWGAFIVEPNGEVKEGDKVLVRTRGGKKWTDRVSRVVNEGRWGTEVTCGRPGLQLRLQPLDGGDPIDASCDVEALRWQDTHGKKAPGSHPSNAIGWGWAITCHKAQGSEWEKVAVVDDAAWMWHQNPDHYQRWLYTAVSRASSRLVYSKMQKGDAIQ